MFSSHGPRSSRTGAVAVFAVGTTVTRSEMTLNAGRTPGSGMKTTLASEMVAAGNTNAASAFDTDRSDRSERGTNGAARRPVDGLMVRRESPWRRFAGFGAVARTDRPRAAPPPRTAPDARVEKGRFAFMVRKTLNANRTYAVGPPTADPVQNLHHPIRSPPAGETPTTYCCLPSEERAS